MTDQVKQAKAQVSSDSTFTARTLAPRIKVLTPIEEGGDVEPVYIAYCRRWSYDTARDAIDAIGDRLPGYSGETYAICAYAFNEANEQVVQEAYHNWQSRAWEVDKFHRELETKHGRTIQYNELAKLLPKHLRDVDINGKGNTKDPAWVALCNELISGVIHVTENNPLPVMPESDVPYRVTFGKNGDKLSVKRVVSLPPKQGRKVVFKSRIHTPGEPESNILGDDDVESDDLE